MTFEELQKFYVSGYRFKKETGMSAMSYSNWKRQGCIPTFSQLRIEKLTKGKLKADWGDE